MELGGSLHFSPFSTVLTVLASGRLLNLCCATFLHEPDAGAWKNSAYNKRFLPLASTARCAPSSGSLRLPDVHRTVFAQEHADYIGINVEG